VAESALASASLAAAEGVLASAGCTGGFFPHAEAKVATATITTRLCFHLCVITPPPINPVNRRELSLMVELTDACVYLSIVKRTAFV
jgi:hypothetical protein